MSIARLISLIGLLCIFSQAAFAQESEAAPIPATQVLQAAPIHIQATQVSQADGDSFLWNTNQWSAGIGFPGLTYLGVARPFYNKQRLGLRFGYIPARFILGTEVLSQTSEFSDSFDMQVDPEVDIFSLGVGHDYFLTDRLFLQSGVSLLLINAKGMAHLTRKDSGESFSVAEISLTGYQPIASVELGYQLLVRKNWSLDVGGGLAFLFSPALQTQISGAAPAFLTTAPEYNTALVDSTNRFEEDLNDVVGDLLSSSRVLPTIFIQGSW